MFNPLSHLTAGETILWQGKPLGRIRFEGGPFINFAVAIFMVIFSTFWMVLASSAGGFFWMFGLIFLSVGLYGTVGIHFWEAFRRRHQHYTLTNHRAMIETHMFGRTTLKSFPIKNMLEVEFIDQGQTGDILFGSETKWQVNQRAAKKLVFNKLKMLTM